MNYTKKYSNAERAAHKGNIIRGDINRNADYDLEEWIQQRLQIKKGDTVLDVGCGSGKQLKAFSPLVGPSGKVIGSDIFSKIEGLREAAEASMEGSNWVSLLDHDASERFPNLDDSIDIITSCYSIYYVKNIRETIQDFYRILKPGGKCFITGPSWDNSNEFYALHTKLTDRKLSPDFEGRLNRINDEVVPAARDIFANIKISPFVNRVYFRGPEGVDALVDYYKNSLMYQECLSHIISENVIGALRQYVRDEIELHGYFSIIKRGLGLMMEKK